MSSIVRRIRRGWEPLIWVTVGGGGVLLLSRLPLLRAVLLVGGVGFMLLALIWPPITFPALALAVPFGPGLPLGGFTVGTTDLLIGLIVALWLLRGWAHRDWKWPSAPLVWPLLLYLGAISLSLAQAWSLSAALPEFLKWVEILALYVAVSAILPSQKRPRFLPSPFTVLLVSLLGAGALEALLGIAQFLLRLGPPGFIVLGRFLRAYGTFAQPNPYAGYLGLIFPLALSLALHTLSDLLSPRSARQPTNWGTLLSLWFYPVTAMLIGLGLLASWSRGGWLGMLAGSAVVFTLRSRRAAILSGLIGLLLIAGIILGLMGLLPPVVAQRFQGIQDWTLFLRPVELRAIRVTGTNFALVERMAHWWAAYAMWKAHPLLGVGIGNYAVAYEAYRMPGWKEPLGHAHNILLNVLAETGLVGLGAYLLLWTWIFVTGLRSLREHRGMRRAVQVGALGGLMHLTVHNLFDNLYVHGIYAYVALLLVLLTVNPGMNGSIREGAS